MSESTKRERLTEALAAVGVFFIDKWGWLLGCVKCTAHTPRVGWHPFDGPDVPEYEFDEETNEEVEREIFTAEEEAKLEEWRQRGGLRAGYWLCPNGCNHGAELPAEFHPEVLGLRAAEHLDAIGHVLDAADEAEFKAWVEALPDDDPAFMLKTPTEFEARQILHRFSEQFREATAEAEIGQDGDPPERDN